MFNKAILLGNLTNQPELRYLQSGTALCKFGMAINRKYGTGEDKKEEVLFIGITVWGKQAESCGQYLDKGSQVLVEGRLQQSNWETDSGEKRSKIEVTAESVKFLSKLNEQKPRDNAPIPDEPEAF